MIALWALAANQSSIAPPIIRTTPILPQFQPVVPNVQQQVTIEAPADTSETFKFTVIGNWHVRIDKTLQGGCYTYLQYANRSSLRLSIDPTSSHLYMMVGSPFWRSLVSAKAHKTKITFGRNTPWIADGNVIQIGEIRYVAFKADDAGIIDEMSTSTLMQLTIDGVSLGMFSTVGAKDALSALGRCQKMVEQVVDPFAKK